MGNGFRAQWEDFIRHVLEDGPHAYDFRSGARGVRLAELAMQSSVNGQRIEVPAELDLHNGAAARTESR
jgi:predicted dehydrogenase